MFWQPQLGPDGDLTANVSNKYSLIASCRASRCFLYAVANKPRRVNRSSSFKSKADNFRRKIFFNQIKYNSISIVSVVTDFRYQGSLHARKLSPTSVFAVVSAV